MNEVTGAAGPPRLQVRDVSKTYGPVRVLTDVSLTLAADEVHGLVGQNGSGKFILVKILSGQVRPDGDAALSVDGERLDLPARPDQLNRHGVSFVHQDLGLLEDATVVENIRMGRLRRHPASRRIQWNGEIERAADILAGLRARIDPRIRVGELRPNQRALVAIAPALQSEKAVQDIVPSGAAAVAVEHDVRHEQSSQALVDGALASFGRLDILVNNASVGPRPGPLHTLTQDEHDRVMSINALGVFLTSKATVVPMIEHRRGRIIHISSVVAKRASPNIIPYAASKWAVIGMTQTMARELVQYDITVNAVCPGVVRTDPHEGVVSRMSTMLNKDTDTVWKPSTTGSPSVGCRNQKTSRPWSPSSPPTRAATSPVLPSN